VAICLFRNVAMQLTSKKYQLRSLCVVAITRVNIDKRWIDQFLDPCTMTYFETAYSVFFCSFYVENMQKELTAT